MGVVGRPHGVRGHVHVHSYAAEPSDLANYYPLSDEFGRNFALRWVGEGIAELFSLDGGLRRKIADRTAAEKLVNAKLYVDRSQLPPPDEDEFYLADLVGLTAVDVSGNAIGVVEAVHDYGGGASLEIAGSFVPFSRASVPGVDLAAGRVTVAAPAEVNTFSPPLAGGVGGGAGSASSSVPLSPLTRPLPRGEGRRKTSPGSDAR
jgi:16S rRNA processing protein RimM